MQIQFELIKNKTNEILTNLSKRSLLYIPLANYEGFVEEYKKSIETVNHNIHSSFLDFKKE